MPYVADFAAHPDLAPALSQAHLAIQAVHRRPVNLRKFALTSSESAVRGAAMAQRCSGVDLQQCMAAYSVLAPDVVEATTRTFLRAPLQVLAKIDVLAGGDGRPRQGSAAQLQQLAALLQQRPPADGAILAGIVQAGIIATNAFDARSVLIGLVASRCAAISYGFDPRGLGVPETWLHRHRQRYLASAHASLNSEEAMIDFLGLFLEATIKGAAEAEGIAEAAKG
ncbi:hypothetical protein [Corynebacterium pelargi]|nr:hypothetical protein [Corynebacterium pelargi]